MGLIMAVCVSRLGQTSQKNVVAMPGTPGQHFLSHFNVRQHPSFEF